MIAEYVANLPVRMVKGTIRFFYFWYVRSSKDFWNKEIAFLKQIEKDLGVIINLKLVFRPIFGDYSYMGRIIGPVFRLGRVLIGFVIMMASIFVVVAIFLLWIILPPLAFLMMFLNLVYVL